MAIRLKSCLPAFSRLMGCSLPSLLPIGFLRQQQAAKTEPDVDSIAAGNKIAANLISLQSPQSIRSIMSCLECNPIFLYIRCICVEAVEGAMPSLF